MRKMKQVIVRGRRGRWKLVLIVRNMVDKGGGNVY